MYTPFIIDSTNEVEILFDNEARRFISRAIKSDELDIYKYAISCNYDEYLVNDLNKPISKMSLNTSLVVRVGNIVRNYLYEHINQNNLYNLPDISIIETDHGPIVDVSKYLNRLGLFDDNKLFNLYVNPKLDIQISGMVNFYKVYQDSKSDCFINLLYHNSSSTYYASRALVIYNPYKSRLELCFIDNSTPSHLLSSVELSTRGFILKVLGKGFKILNPEILDRVLHLIAGDCYTDTIDSKVIEAVNKKYDINKPYSEISSLDELSTLYHIKYPRHKLEELLNKYNTKIDLLRAGNPGITYLNLELLDDKVILDRIVTGKSNINIAIPDWVWGYVERSADRILPDCVTHAEIKFSRPIPYSVLFMGCTHLKSLKLYGLDIRFSNTDGMFENCSSLSELYFDEAFKLQDSKSCNYMFYNCKNLYYKNIHSENRFSLSSKCAGTNLMFLHSGITEANIFED